MATEKKQNIKEYSNSILCSEIIFEKVGGIVEHTARYHDHIEILYAEKSNANLWIGDAPYRFSSNDLAIIVPGVKHTEPYMDGGHYYNIKITPDALYSSERSLSEYKCFTSLLSPGFRKKIYTCNELENTDVHKLILEIMQEWVKRQEGYELIIRANIIKLFTILYRVNNVTHKQLQSIEGNETIRRALEFTERNYATATEQVVAEHCGFCIAYFSTIFKNTVGIKFGEYLMKLKLQKAKELLLSTNKSITFIAYETGFSSASHFIARFKEYENVTPAKFRKKVHTSSAIPTRAAASLYISFHMEKCESGKYLIFKYRTNGDAGSSEMPFYCSSQGPHTQLDLSWVRFEPDEKWHVIIIDMEKTTQRVKSFTPAEDGKFYARYVQFHLFCFTELPSNYFDFAFIAFTKSIDDALKLVEAGDSVSFGIFTANQWVTMPLEAKLPQSTSAVPPKHHYVDSKNIFKWAANKGQSLRKIERIDEYGVSFTRIWSY